VLFPERERDQTITPGASATLGTILVVDDDAGVRSVAQRALTSVGYHVVTATNGTEGIALLERGKGEISLALVDVTMPEMSGFDLVRELRERGLSTPVVLSSGYELDAAQAKEAGSSGILAKPYDVAELLRAVERVLGEPK
jgi:CheY-like chemotaxis protein